MKTETEIKDWVKSLTPPQLITQYDMFSFERVKLANSLGGRHISGDDAKKCEALTLKINIMRRRMAHLMGEMK